MGKKRIIQKSQEELLKEREKVETMVKKEYEPSSVKKEIGQGRIYIFASYNNTIITLADQKGNVLGWISAGKIGFKGAKKSTPFAASKTAEAVSQIAQKLGIQKVEIFVNGVGSGRESAIRSLASRGFDIVSIKDVTPIPHNGCRSRKVRRV